MSLIDIASSAYGRQQQQEQGAGSSGVETLSRKHTLQHLLQHTCCSTRFNTCFLRPPAQARRTVPGGTCRCASSRGLAARRGCNRCSRQAPWEGAIGAPWRRCLQQHQSSSSSSKCISSSSTCNSRSRSCLLHNSRLQPQLGNCLLQHTCCSTPVAGHMLQHTCCSTPVAAHLLQHTCCSTPVAAHLLQHTCCSTPVAAHLLQHICCSTSVAAHLLQDTCCSTPVAAHLLQHTCCSTHVASPTPTLRAAAGVGPGPRACIAGPLYTVPYTFVSLPRRKARFTPCALHRAAKLRRCPLHTMRRRARCAALLTRSSLAGIYTVLYTVLCAYFTLCFAPADSERVRHGVGPAMPLRVVGAARPPAGPWSQLDSASAWLRFTRAGLRSRAGSLAPVLCSCPPFATALSGTRAACPAGAVQRPSKAWYCCVLLSLLKAWCFFCAHTMVVV